MPAALSTTPTGQHQSLAMAFPASRFTPASSPLELRIPAQQAADTHPPKSPQPAADPLPAPTLPSDAAPQAISVADTALPAIVADQQLEQAWAATEARTYTASLVGPALGGFLFGLGSAVPFAGDAALYLVSAEAVSRIRSKFRAERSGEHTALWREAIEGLNMVWHNQLLGAVIIHAPLVNFVFSGAIFTITLAPRRAGTAPGIIGLTLAGIMVGGLLGAVIAPKLQGRLSLWHLAIVITMAGTVLLGVAAVVLPSPLVALPIEIPILLALTVKAALVAAMLRATPEGMRGRGNSAVVVATTGLAALAPLTTGLLAEHVSGHWAMAAFAAAIGIAAIICMALPGRNAEGSASTTGTVR